MSTSIVSPRDLRRMNAAFFTLNGVISVVFFVFVAADVLLRALEKKGPPEAGLF